MASDSKFTYKSAGVDIDRADSLVEDIKSAAKQTARSELVSGIGGFGAAFAVPSGYDEPVLVSCTDGVGTKLNLAAIVGDHSGIGRDLVAMCVNDLICLGAEPLFFLDYYATGVLEPEVARVVIAGIVAGCLDSGMSLVGGETAELPGLYKQGDYDLAGFSVGIVERSRLHSESKVKPGDVLIGLSSSGIHSNGFALINKLIQTLDIDLQQDIAGSTLAERLLEPTKIYVQALRQLEAVITPHAIAHITGGGLQANVMRVIPKDMGLQIDAAWPQPEIFAWLEQIDAISQSEMRRVFNMGLGMVLVVAAQDASSALETLTLAGESAHIIGSVTDSAAVVHWQ